MFPSVGSGQNLTGLRLLKLLSLLWLAGASSRIIVLAIPPIIPLLHHDLHMSETEVGILVGLPLVTFVIASVPGSLLVARFGTLATMFLGLAIAGLAAAGRGAATTLWMLYLTTFVMGVGIAFMQPALPALVREWLPERVGLGTAAFTNGIVVGVALVAALTIPVVLPLVGQSWRLDLVVWASPVLATAVLLLFFADRPAAQPGREKLSARIWWPDWRSPLIWLLGLTFGSNNALYFGSNAFLPDYLVSLGRPDLVGAAIGWLNSAQLVASFFLLAAAERLHRRAWPFLVFGLLAFAGVLAIIGANDYWIVAAAGLVGFCTAFTFVLTMALPPLLSLPDDVHRTSAGMFTISYTFGLFVPVISGALWDLTGVPASAFVPLAVCALTLMTFGSFLCLQGQRLAHPPN